MDESLDEHFGDYDDCASSFAQWNGARSSGSGGSRSSGPSRVQQAIGWVLIAVVILYAVLIQGSLLLGVIASVFIFIASRIDWASVT